MQRGSLYVPRSARPKGYVDIRNPRFPNTDTENISPADTTITIATSSTDTIPFDTIFAHLPVNEQHNAVQRALQRVTLAESDFTYKVDIIQFDQRNLNRHRIEIWQKVTLALACIVFFFIGAPLGAIIRKGGLGFPVVVAVIIFIFYYMVNTFGKHLATTGVIPPFVGMWFSTIVLTPIGIFLTVKANNDSVVFNWDTHSARLRRLWGIKPKRHISCKEVIIHDPDYALMAQHIQQVASQAADYRSTHRLNRMPNYFQVYFSSNQDQQVEQISLQLEQCIDTLSNSKDYAILRDLNGLPILDIHAHIAPFTNQRINRITGVFFPIGLLLLLRVLRFRQRLRHDLKAITQVGTKLAIRCNELNTITKNNQ